LESGQKLTEASILASILALSEIELAFFIRLKKHCLIQAMHFFPCHIIFLIIEQIVLPEVVPVNKRTFPVTQNVTLTTPLVLG